jgi:hypothetical protein
MYENENLKESELNFLPGLNENQNESESESEILELESQENSLSSKVVDSISEIDEDIEHARVIKKMNDA